MLYFFFFFFKLIVAADHPTATGYQLSHISLAVTGDLFTMSQMNHLLKIILIYTLEVCCMMSSQP